MTSIAAKKPESLIFKSPEAEADYLLAYNRTLTTYGAPVESRFIETRFGTTHLLVAGTAGNPPLLLLPGTYSSATMWLSNFEGLSEHFRLYAPDLIGEVGRNKPHKLPTDAADYGRWLTDLLDGLTLETVNLAGLSLGGFLACSYSLSTPERVRRLALLNPAQTIYPMRKMLAMAAMPVLFYPNALTAKLLVQRLFYRTPELSTHPFLEQFALAIRRSKALPVLPVVLEDADLRRLETKTLLLLGEKEVIYNPFSVVERARRLIPNLEYTIVPGAGHMINCDQPTAVNRRLVKFFKDV